MAKKDFTIKLDSKDLLKLIKKYQKRGLKFDAFLEAGVRRGMFPIERLLKTKYLSGGILDVQTGRLRSSTRSWITTDKNVVFGIIGTNVKYAPAHEFGFSGSVTVPQHMRVHRSGKVSQVRSHSRFINLRERAPFRKAIRSRKTEFMKILLKTVMAGLKKTK